MDTDLDTLAIALYVTIDDLLGMAPQRAPWRPVIGFSPQISDAELVTLAVMQAPSASTATSSEPDQLIRIATKRYRSYPFHYSAILIDG